MGSGFVDGSHESVGAVPRRRISSGRKQETQAHNGENLESNRGPTMSSNPAVIKVENYMWKQVKEFENTTKERTYVEQTYEVFYEGGKQTSRLNAMNIPAGAISEYWERVKESMEKREKKLEQGETVEESEQAKNYREAFESSEELRLLNLPNVLTIDLHGFGGKRAEMAVKEMDAKVDAMLNKMRSDKHNSRLKRKSAGK